MSAVIEAHDRRKFIGGSDISVLLGVNPYRSVLGLWQDKTQPTREDGHNAAAKRRGSRLEPYVRDMIAEEHQIEITASGQRYKGTQPWEACEIDFEWSDAGQPRNGEIKTVHPFKRKEWGDEFTDELPLFYVAQTQWGLGITNRERCDVFALIGDDLRRYVVQRDDELIQIMRDKAAEFWTRYVEPNVRPPIDWEHKLVVDELKRLYPGTDGTITTATAMHEHWRAVWETSQRMAKHYDSIIEGARAHLLAEMGSGSAIRFNDGREFARKLITKRGYTITVEPSQYVDFRLTTTKEQQ